MYQQRTSTLQQLKLNQKFKTVILATIQQQFRKTNGKSYNWNILRKNQTIHRMFVQMRLLPNNSQDVSHFRRAIQKLLEGHQKYQWKYQTDQKETDKTICKIKRKNLYQNVIDYHSLIKQVQKHPQGLLVDQQLKCFTCRDIDKYIKKAVEDNMIRKINKEVRQEIWYLFPRQLEIEHQVRMNQHKFFGMKEYLDLCTHLNTKNEGEEKVKGEKKSRAKGSVADLNYQLPGYLQAKDQWLKKKQKA